MTAAAMNAFQQLNQDLFVSADDFAAVLAECTVIIDAVYGFGFHGSLNDAMRPLFQTVNQTDKMIISIDINSGCECDSGRCDPDAIRSDLTLVLDCYKPFHMLRKELDGRFQKSVQLVVMASPHPKAQPVSERWMRNSSLLLPVARRENVYKGTFRKDPSDRGLLWRSQCPRTESYRPPRPSNHLIFLRHGTGGKSIPRLQWLLYADLSSIPSDETGPGTV